MLDTPGTCPQLTCPASVITEDYSIKNKQKDNAEVMQTKTCADRSQFINPFFLNNPAEMAAALLPVLPQRWRASSDYQSWLPPLACSAGPPSILVKDWMLILEAGSGSGVVGRGEVEVPRCSRRLHYSADGNLLFCRANGSGSPPNNLLFLCPLFLLGINWPKSSKVMRAPRAPPP